nr:hypothetical protein [Burkholderia sp. WTPI3]
MEEDTSSELDRAVLEPLMNEPAAAPPVMTALNRRKSGRIDDPAQIA